MWFGTKDGLDRFDGYTFKIFQTDADDSGSIGNNFIHCLYQDPNGILWVGTEGGLYRYDENLEKFTIYKPTINAPIREINMDGRGNLWFIMGFTLCRFNPSTNQFVIFPISAYFEVSSVCTTLDGALWASTSSGLLKKYNDATLSFSSYDMFAKSTKNQSKWIEKIYPAFNNRILIGTSIGVKLFNTTTAVYKDLSIYDVNKAGIFIRNFLQVNDKEIWIASELGIFIYNIETGYLNNLQKKYNDPYSISDNAVYTFCKDKEGGIWVGTYFGGINYYPKQYNSFEKYFPKSGENSLGGNVVREIHEDVNNNLWIGTEDAGLNKLNNKTGLFTNFKPNNKKGSISYSNIHGLLATGNELWIGTFEHGLDVMDIKSEKVIKHYEIGTGKHALKSNFIYCIQQTDKGEIIIGTTIGAYRFNRQENNFDSLPGMPLNNWYAALWQDKNGIIWAGTYGNGINYYNTITHAFGNLKHIANNKTSLPSDRVNNIFEDSKNNIWFATEGGLSKLNKTEYTFKTYGIKNGFPTDYILNILEDKNNNLWISTTRGLVCFNPKTEEVNIYTRTNGLLNDQFNFNSAYKSVAGKMYFGSVKGMISFDPNEFNKNIFIPSVFITGFQVNNKELDIAKNNSPLQKTITNTSRITLNYNQSTFSIDFASLNYASPKMSEYSYKMDGLDKDWTYLKTNRTVYFTDLSPGIYTFKVKASNGNITWDKAETTLIIEILPPWWASGWAYLIYTLALLAFVYYLIRRYHHKSEEKSKRKIEQLGILKEKETFQAKIDFFTNVAHEIRTPLTLIKGPLEKVIRKTAHVPEIKDSLKMMERNTNRLVDLTNQLLDFRQTEISGFRLNFIKADINELLEETYLNFKPLAEQKNLFYNINLPQKKLFAFIDTEAFIKILSNLFSNAVKYANSRVSVSLLPTNDEDLFFTIEIKNDGFIIPTDLKEKIFEPFFRLKETQKQRGTGIGLALSRSLAQLHKGVLDVKETSHNLNTFFVTLPIGQGPD